MYAIVKTGGKQYRVSEGEWLLVERLTADDGATVDLQPLLIVDGDSVLDGDALADQTVQALILGQERGPKLRIVKFKPKRGYKRRTGHRQDLTRIQITRIGSGGSRLSGASDQIVAPVPATAASAPSEEVSDGS